MKGALNLKVWLRGQRFKYGSNCSSYTLKTLGLDILQSHVVTSFYLPNYFVMHDYFCSYLFISLKCHGLLLIVTIVKLGSLPLVTTQYFGDLVITDERK